VTDAARWAQVQTLFHAVADLEGAAQDAALREATQHDPSLYDEVHTLLAADRRDDHLLDRTIGVVAAALLDPNDAPLPTQRFGPYRITARLGEGGMGVVYRGVRDDLNASAAIKILRDATLSPARRARFAAEQRTLAQLIHPGIARLYDADTLPDGTPWFAMELVEGATLTEWRTAASRSLAERLDIFQKIGDAVRHAHAHAVIHRDLKPSNILVTPDGAVKLVDFGIARQIAPPDGDATPTETGLRLLTPAYASPEQLRAAPLGVQTDVYALGVIFYELLTGVLPHDLAQHTPSEAATILLEHEPLRPSLRTGPGMVRAPHAGWADLDVLTLTAMHRDPTRRYQSVEALLRDVSHFTTGEPLEARPDSFGYRSAKFLQRRRREVIAGATVVLLIAGIVGTAAVRLKASRDVAVTEAARAARIQRFMLSLFQGDDGDVLSADSLRVRTLLDRGVREARALDGDPLVQLELLATLGGITQQVGDFARADTLLQDALTRQRALTGGAHPDVARRLIALGLLRTDQAEYDSAEVLVREGLEVALRARAPVIATDAREALGQVLGARSAYDTALAVLDTVLQARRMQGDTLAEAVALVLLANTHFDAGQYDDADSLNRLALPIYQRLRGPQHPLVADILINLGAIRFQRGDYAGAEARYREALAIVEPWYGREHYATASAYTMLGRALVPQSKDAEATSVLEQALAIQERINGPVHPRVASALNELGTVALRAGRLDEAEARYRRMLAIYTSVHGERHWLPGIAWSNLGSVAMGRKDYRLAERMYRNALRQFISGQGAEHLNTGIARVKLARALLRDGRPTEAITEGEAGLTIVLKHAEPTVSWAVSAKADLDTARSRIAAGGRQ
jgi:serine/threonine-protein kinase